MKKKLKIFLLILLIVILVTAGTLLYLFKFKEYDVADEEVTKIIEDPYVIEMPDGTTITVDENGDIVETAGNAQAPGNEGTSSDGTATDGNNAEGTNTDSNNAEGTYTDGNNTEGTGTDSNNAEGTGTDGNNTEGTNTGTTKSDGTTTDAGTTPGEKVPTATTGDSNTTQKSTVGSIKQKYIPTLDNLQTQADSKLNTLISHAKTEYTTKKANGESISYAYFYNKYVGAAEGLEANTDAVFTGVIKAVEKDLVTNGYDKSYAQNLVDDYDAAKKARKDSLLSKAIGL